jgi:hypothetical protein
MNTKKNILPASHIIAPVNGNPSSNAGSHAGSMHERFGISVLKDRQPGVQVVAHLDERRLYLIGACFTELILNEHNVQPPESLAHEL